MRALVKARPGPGVELITKPEPHPGPDEVVLKVANAGICGTDLHIFHWDRWSQEHMRLPRVLGHEFCGEVVELGERVSTLAIDDFVAVESHVPCFHCAPCRGGELHLCQNLQVIGIDRDGAFADYVAIPAFNAWKLDDSIDRSIASVLEPLGNAVHATLMHPVAGQRLAVMGCGPIGLFSIAVAKKAGAAAVFASDPNPARRRLAATMGADAVLDPAADDVPQAIRDLTEGAGADVALEMSGNQKGVTAALHCVRNGGYVTFFGLPSAAVSIDLAEEFILKGLHARGVFGRELFGTWKQMTGLLRAGLDITPLITHRFDLGKFDQAFQLLEAGEAAKIILTP